MLRKSTRLLHRGSEQKKEREKAKFVPNFALEEALDHEVIGFSGEKHRASSLRERAENGKSSKKRRSLFGSVFWRFAVNFEKALRALIFPSGEKQVGALVCLFLILFGKSRVPEQPAHDLFPAFQAIAGGICMTQKKYNVNPAKKIVGRNDRADMVY